MRKLWTLALATGAAVCLWDFLFYEHVAGFTRGVFSLALLALLAWAHPGSLQRPVALGAAGVVAAAAVSQCVEPTNLAFALAWAGLAAFGAVARLSATPHGTEWGRLWARTATVGWFAWFPDFAGASARLAGRHGWRGRLGRWLERWLLPLLLAVPFVVLFAVANPLIELGFESFFDWLEELFEALSLPRILTWTLVAAGTWALLRFLPDTSPSPATRPGFRLEGAMLVRCLAVFNALFAVQTALDLGYFWSGFELPQGMTYAGYAHRGAYPLVGTTLLAILFVLKTFDDARLAPALAKRLVYVWLAQNAFLLASAAGRLALYIDVYKLTYFRIAAAIWMLLIAIGLFFTVLKIATHRSNAWLVDANLLAAALVLALACFPNYDRWIADYNVEQAIARRGYVDDWYLGGLGPDALPALHRWHGTGLGGPEATCGSAARALARLEEEERGGWRAWTLRRALREPVDPLWLAQVAECPHR